MLKSLAVYEGGRCQAGFEDDSAMILHESHKTLTYFSSSGIESRLTMDQLPSEVRQKCKYMVMLYNYSCSDSRFIQMDWLHSDDDIVLSADSVISSRWPSKPISSSKRPSPQPQFGTSKNIDPAQTEDLIKRLLLDNNANASDSLTQYMPDTKSFKFTALEGQCSITLHYSGWLVEIEYLRVVRQQKKGLTKGESNRLKSRLTTSKDRQTQAQMTSIPEDDEIVLASQCVMQTQKFHICNFPTKFSYPVYVLLQDRYRMFNEESIRHKMESLFCYRFREILARVQIYNEISEDSEAFLRSEYSISYLSDFFIVQLNSFKDVEAQIKEATKPEPKMSRLAKMALSFKRDTNNDGKTSVQSRIRSQKDDTLRQSDLKASIADTLDRTVLDGALTWYENCRNPSTDILAVDGYVSYIYFASFEAFYADGISLTISLRSGSIIVNSMSSNQYTVASKDGAVKTMTIGCVYPIREVVDGQIVSEEKIDAIIDLVDRAKRLNNAYLSYARDKMIKKKAEAQNYSGIKSNQQEKEEGDPWDVVSCMASKRAVCEAFRNKSVKLKFTDRTILSFDPNCDTFSIITKFGEQNSILVSKPGPFIDYFQEAVEFQDLVFTDPRERQRRIDEMEGLQRAVHQQLEYSKYMSTIVSGKNTLPIPGNDSLLYQRRDYKEIPPNPIPYQTSNKPYLEDNSQDPFDSSRHLNSIQSFECSDTYSMQWRSPQK
jgi:hypothetical protein